MFRPRLTRLRSQAGQAIVLIALTGTLMIAGIGLAVDVVIGYLYQVSSERAAAAAALSGVVFMPDQFTGASAVPVGSRNDATDRAVDEAKRNGFDPTNTADGVVVTPSRVPGHTNQLQVTVGRQAPVFFMVMFGFKPYQVSATAIAAYLPPISLGQPGSQAGSSLGELGRTRFFFVREEGWATDRSQGDAYTPNNLAGGYGPSDDVHQISYANGTEPRDTSVSDRGGYDYQIAVPSGGLGGVVQVYNAAFAPDGTGGTANMCDNNAQNPGSRTCSIGGNNWFHEDDGSPFNFGTPPNNYATMRYSLYRVNNVFIRSSDQLLSQLTVYPIDARNWRNAVQQYTILGGPNLGQTVDQQYAGNLPTNMLIYHNWVDVTSYSGAQDNGLVSLRTTPALSNYQVGGALQPGTYRLRVDSLDSSGTTFTGGSTGAHKGYAVRAVNGDANRTACSNCTVASWDEVCFFTPFDAGPGGSFTMNLFQLTPDYAGLTVTIDIWDVGDISSTSGFVRINILDPTGALAGSPLGVNIYDLGVQRSNLARGQYTVIASAQGGNQRASFVATDTSQGISRNSHWVHIELPISPGYNPPPGQYWWSMQYVTGAGTVAIDTVTVAVGLKGGPVHLVG
ncbi:MAG: hypothetical protein E6J01_15330 [Chloroflexi bacterium]|nr:MAG: hypothetical protein E6J01_15330 [Chloroflexota bacterium]